MVTGSHDAPATATQRRRMPRAPRRHAGEGIADGYNIPGIVLCALAMVVLESRRVQVRGKLEPSQRHGH